MIKNKNIIICFIVFQFLSIQLFSAQTQKSIGITAFENLDKDKEFDWIGVGFAETVASKLAYIKSLKIAEKSQLNKIIKEQKLQMSGAIDQNTIVEIGKFLDVEYIITGDYQKSGGELKVTAKIFDIETSKEINPVEVKVKFTDLFDIQNALVFKIIQTIKAPISEQEKIKIIKPVTKNIIVYEWYAKGEDSYEKNEYDASLECYNKALKESEKDDKNETIKSIILNSIGNIYAENGDYTNAMEYYNNGLKIVMETGDDQLSASYYNNIGILLSQKGEISRALENLEKSLKLYQKNKNESDIAATYFNIGCIYKNKTEYGPAIVYFNKSLKIARRITDEKLIAELCINIANIFATQKDYKSVLDYCTEALKVIEKIAGDLQRKSIYYANVADIYRNIEKYKEAISLYNRSLETIETGKKIKDENLKAMVLYNIAVLYGEQSDYKIALYFANRALDTYNKLNDEKNIKDTQEIINQLKEESGKNGN